MKIKIDNRLPKIKCNQCTNSNIIILKKPSQLPKDYTKECTNCYTELAYIDNRGSGNFWKIRQTVILK